MILLDSDILIDFFRGHTSCRAWLSSLGARTVGLPVFVAMEIYAGCRNKREQLNIQKELAVYALIWPDESAGKGMVLRFADAHLTHSTGILDSLIAATALSHHLPLHTFNVKHFAAFPDLVTIQPYAR
jgi:tRNA(fMet)-specific endonuclease VapC